MEILILELFTVVKDAHTTQFALFLLLRPIVEVLPGDTDGTSRDRLYLSRLSRVLVLASHAR